MFEFRSKTVSLAFAVVLLVSLTAFGDNTPDTRPPFRPDGPPPFNPEWMEEHFSELDRNQNGSLSKEEIFSEDAQPERPPHPDFLLRLDVNGDGEIQASELKAMSEEHAIRQREFFRDMDKDGDGDVSLAEFQAFRPGPMHPPRGDSQFAKEDPAGKDRPQDRDFAPPTDRPKPPHPPLGHEGEKCMRGEPNHTGDRPTPEEMEAHFAQMQRETFERLDENHDGRLQLDEMRRLPHFGPPPPPRDDVGMREESTDNTDGTVSLAAASSATGVQPTEFRLEQNYPNPFNSSTIITYDIPVACHVTLTVYNVSGEMVKTLVDEIQPASYYQINLKMSDETSGQYFYRLQAGSFADVQKMIYVK